jgi:hypothetical protein
MITNSLPIPGNAHIVGVGYPEIGVNVLSSSVSPSQWALAKAEKSIQEGRATDSSDENDPFDGLRGNPQGQNCLSQVTNRRSISRREKLP